MYTLNFINIRMICLYIILTFFLVPRNFQSYFAIIFLGSFLFINITYGLKNRNNFKIKLFRLFENSIVYKVFLVINALIIIISPYDTKFTIGIFVFLLIANICINEEEEIKVIFNRNWNKIIYYFCLISIIIQLIIGRYSTINGKISLAILGDKNYSGVAILLFFMYCDKFEFKIGKILSVFTILIIGSRASILVFILFFIVKLLRRLVFNLLNLFKLDRIYKIFIIMGIFIVLFSYFWVSSISANGVVEYQQGINDGSNKMRFGANVYVIESLKNNKELIFYGYDNDFSEIVGISSENPDEHVRFKGARLVQPHNSILNIIIKSGVLFSLFYFYILSKIIDNKYSIYNLEYIIPYLISSLFLHRLLDSKFLIFWIIILCMPSNKIKDKDIERMRWGNV